MSSAVQSRTSVQYLVVDHMACRFSLVPWLKLSSFLLTSANYCIEKPSNLLGSSCLRSLAATACGTQTNAGTHDCSQVYLVEVCFSVTATNPYCFCGYSYTTGWWMLFYYALPTFWKFKTLRREFLRSPDASMKANATLWLFRWLMFDQLEKNTTCYALKHIVWLKRTTCTHNLFDINKCHSFAQSYTYIQSYTNHIHISYMDTLHVCFTLVPQDLKPNPSNWWLVFHTGLPRAAHPWNEACHKHAMLSYWPYVIQSMPILY